MLILKEYEDIEDFVRGATILGTGGGGDPQEGLKLLKEGLSRAGKIKLINLEELSEDDIIVVPYYVGTIAPTAKTKKPVKISNPIKIAIEEMEKVLGRKVTAVTATELGGFNASIALYIGAELNMPVVDGDLLGRAAPELHQCIVHVFKIPMYPSVLVSETGNKIVIYEYSDIDDYEAIARYLSMLSGRFVAVVDTPLTLEKARAALIKGTLSKCLKLGRVIREARKLNEDPIEKVVKELDGWKIFLGVVEDYKWRDERGFLIGEVKLKGLGKYSGKTLKTWIMNEHIMAWLNDKPIVMPPDLIMFLDDSGEGITNSELKVGMKINVIAAKAPEIWRSPEGLKLFGPRKFGLDYDYTPVEELVRVGI